MIGKDKDGTIQGLAVAVFVCYTCSSICIKAAQSRQVLWVFSHIAGHALSLNGHHTNQPIYFFPHYGSCCVQ